MSKGAKCYGEKKVQIRNHGARTAYSIEQGVERGALNEKVRSKHNLKVRNLAKWS